MTGEFTGSLSPLVHTAIAAAQQKKPFESSKKHRLESYLVNTSIERGERSMSESREGL